MLKHIVLMQFPDPSDAAEAERRLGALADEIDFVRELHVGHDIVGSDRSYDLGLVVTLDSADDLDRYRTHPAHEEVAAFIRERRSASAACDFVVD